MAKKNLTIWLEPEWVARVDKLAAKADISRTRLLENVVKMNVEELEAMDKVGFFAFSKVLRDLQERIRACSQRSGDSGLIEANGR